MAEIEILVGNDEYPTVPREKIGVGTVRVIGLLEPGALEGHHCNFGYAGYAKALVWSGRSWASLTRAAMESLGVESSYEVQYRKHLVLIDVAEAISQRTADLKEKPFVFWWWKGRQYAKFSDMVKKKEGENANLAENSGRLD